MRLTALLLILVAAAAGTGCGGDGEGGGDEELTVSAATSLKRAFTAYAERVSGPGVRLSFAGSDELAAQIRQGVKPDVFASANTRLPGRLFAERLVERPVTFAANRLVLAVPAAAAGIGSIEDLVRKGTAIVVGAQSVPVGAYTRAVLGRLDGADRRAILANVRSNEPDVGGIAAKLIQGAADASFLYATDVAASGGRLRAIELPARLRPAVAYGVARVKGARNPGGARRFIAGLLRGAGAEALRGAGFAPPPR